MIFKIILRLIAIVALVSLVSTVYSLNFLYNLLAGDFNRLLEFVGIFRIIEPFFLLVFIMGGIRLYKNTPLLSLIYIHQWLMRSFDIIYNSFTMENHYSPLMVWIGVYSDILLSILCIISIIIIIKEKFSVSGR